MLVRMVLLRDVTEQRLAEEKLNISEALFRNLVEVLPFPVVIFTAASQTEYVNNKFVELFGFELTGMSAYGFGVEQEIYVLNLEDEI